MELANEAYPLVPLPPVSLSQSKHSRCLPFVKHSLVFFFVSPFPLHHLALTHCLARWHPVYQPRPHTPCQPQSHTSAPGIWLLPPPPTPIPDRPTHTPPRTPCASPAHCPPAFAAADALASQTPQTASPRCFVQSLRTPARLFAVGTAFNATVHTYSRIRFSRCAILLFVAASPPWLRQAATVLRR